MAYVLSLRPHSPLKRSFSDNPYLASCSPLKDGTIAALRDANTRNASACSLYSLGSNRAGDWPRVNENTPPLATCSLLDLASPNDAGLQDHVPRKRSCGLNRPAPSFTRVTSPADPYSRRARVTKHSPDQPPNDLTPPVPTVTESITDNDSDIFDLYEATQIPLPEGRWSDNTANDGQDTREIAIEEAATSQPFRRWMSTLRRRHIHRYKDAASDLPDFGVDTTPFPPFVPTIQMTRRLSDSMSSSIDYVTAVRSVSTTIASASIAPRSIRSSVPEGKHPGKRNSHYSEARKSTESSRGALGTIIDESAWLRSAQRRRIVEELISTEESYIADLKVLVNVSS